MYAKVLQICIFTFSIFISEGIPQDYEKIATLENESSDKQAENSISGQADDDAASDHAARPPEPDDKGVFDGTGPNNGATGEIGSGSPDSAGEYHDDAGSNYDSADAENDKTGGYDDAEPDYGPAGAENDKTGGYDDTEPDYGPAGAENDGAGGYDDAEPNYVANADDNGEPNYDYDEYGYESQGQQLDYEEGGSDNDDLGPLVLKLPSSSEILNSNKPEAGFDLSHDEIKKLKLWQDALIPYYIDVHSFNDKVMRDKIRSFLSSVNSLTSLNFVELPSPPSGNMRWVFFMNRRGLLGCADHSIKNFTNVGVQQVVLGYHCMSTEGELAEAVLSIAGVPAQHNSPDRDYYIKIMEENIIPEKKYLFEKLTDEEWLFHDLEYDFKSAGHFHSYKHSINGRATISPQEKAGDVTLGESKTLSASDILKIRMLYNYIVQNKLLQAPDCHKLFEPGKKFGQYKPSDINLKPRPKPFRYTGESPDAPLEEEDDIEDDNKLDEGEDHEEIIAPENDNIDNGDENNNDYQVPPELPNNNENMPEENDVINYENGDYDNADEDHPPFDYNNDYKDSENANNDLPIVIPPEDEEEEESDNYSPTDFHGKRPTIINIGQGPIVTMNKQLELKGIETQQLNDNNNNDRTHLSLPLKKPTKSPDLLAALSDYKTDDENDVWAKQGQHNPNQLSFMENNPKLDLKFRGVG